MNLLARRRRPTVDQCRSMMDLVRGGFALPVYPTTDTGYVAYDAGRLFLPAATNYLTNPSFETDSNSDGCADSWVDSGSRAIPPTFSRPAGRLGGYAQRLQYTGQAGDVGADVDISFNTAVGSFANGDPATLSFYAKGSVTGGTFVCQIVYRSAADGALTSGTSSALTLTDSWVRYSLTVAATHADTSKLRAILRPQGIDNGDVVDVMYDDVLIEKSAVLTPYGDGSYSGWSWSGTAHASTSVRAASSLIYGSIINMALTNGTVAYRAIPLQSYASGFSSSQFIRWDNTLCWHAGDNEFRTTSSSNCQKTYNFTVGIPFNVIHRWAAATLDTAVNGSSATQAARTGSGSAEALTFANTMRGWYLGQVVASPSRITDAETATLSAMLTAGATGLDLFRFFRDKGYRDTLILPLESDSVGYKVVL